MGYYSNNHLDLIKKVIGPKYRHSWGPLYSTYLTQSVTYAVFDSYMNNQKIILAKILLCEWRDLDIGR